MGGGGFRSAPRSMGRTNTRTYAAPRINNYNIGGMRGMGMGYGYGMPGGGFGYGMNPFMGASYYGFGWNPALTIGLSIGEALIRENQRQVFLQE